MADFTTVLEKSKPGYVFQNLAEGRVYNIGVDDPGMTGIKAVATHNVADILDGEALVGGRLIFLESVTSAGAATAQVKIGAVALTAALAIADMAVGKVVSFEMSAASLVLLMAADDTIDIAVGTAALTAGRFLMIVDIVDADAITERG